MQITSFLERHTGMTLPQLFGGTPPLVAIAQDGAGVVTFPVWNVPNTAVPTAEQVKAAIEAPEPGPSVSDLLAYAKTKRVTLAASGKTIDVAQAGAPAKLVFASTDTASLGDLRDACDLAQATSSPTFWSAKGIVTQLSPAEMMTLKTGVQGFVQKTRSVFALVEADITSGAIKTYADIDAFAWPVAG